MGKGALCGWGWGGHKWYETEMTYYGGLIADFNDKNNLQGTDAVNFEIDSP